MSKTVFITGVSTGLGRAFAEVLLNQGYRVIGTLRDDDALASFEALKPNMAVGRLLDVTDFATIENTIREIEENIGAIDVVINNAGYGHEGIFEESTMEDLSRQFEVNVYGPVAVIKAVLPYMRARRAGHIINVTSMGGLMTMPGISFYCGSKFALEGISSSLGKELKPLGIHVTALEPGQMRTDWAGRSMQRSPHYIADYDAIFEPIRAARLAKSGNQQGDPIKAAEALIKLIESEHPPSHLLLGPDAYDFVHRELDSMRAEFAEWESVSRSTNF
jgi:NAD(P)-dependent dehydrogenase (short-subunit alcohol dehydrogenase family)